MTVQELANILAKCDPESPVVFGANDGAGNTMVHLVRSVFLEQGATMICNLEESPEPWHSLAHRRKWPMQGAPDNTKVM